MVLLRTALPSPTTNYYNEYHRKLSVEELDYSLAMLSNYSPLACKSRRQQSTTTSGTTVVLDALNQSGALITPPSTPDSAQRTAHRWSASSASSVGSSTSCASSSTGYQSTSSTASPCELLDKLLLKAPTNTPTVISELDQVMRTTTNVSAAGPNVVAIDNKIEQAMDLVKTHLTFAVREEVEILRSTIVELEAKVAQLESQNQVLKQFAPLEVVNSLAVLVQQQQQKQLQLQQQQQQLSSGGTAPNPQQTNATQNVSQPQQNMQQLQSMPTLSTEASAAPALTTAASAGLIVETQPITELQLPHVINEPEKQQ